MFAKTKVPPIKTQGIKTKLVPFILGNIKWDGKGRWIEPFLGSGVVLFNAQPQKATVADTNKHIINIYQSIQSGKITASSLKLFLEDEGSKLESVGEPYYYEVRERFNSNQSPLDFIFLNRASFNGVIRFNSKGGFNVPFCKKTERFRQAYVTKICNQVAWVSDAMRGKDWDFIVQDWRETMSGLSHNDFVYLDPPYIGRSTDYFNSWKEDDADDLVKKIKELRCGFAYSMWKKNDFRENQHLIEHFSDYRCIVFNHFYHVGSTETLRNPIEEALILSQKSCLSDDFIDSKTKLNLTSMLTQEYKLELA
jgi:DNA adenine methylase